jgi:hypothetical protein
VGRLFHVSSSLNRESIRRHGLDWTRMAAAPGIAGSREPEQPGCFLCVDEWETDWFVRMNNTGGTVDVWAVEGIDQTELVLSPEGHTYLPATVPPEQVSLLRSDIEPVETWDAAAVPDGPQTTSWRFESRLQNPPICTACGVTMVPGALSARDPRGEEWICLECEETAASGD